MAKFTSFTNMVLVALTMGVLQVANGQAAAACARNYTVQPGDFCDKISASQNVSTYQLATVNSAIINPDCSNLFVDEVICLGLVGQDCDQVHVVASGDACSVIAAQANITTAVLLANNPNVNTGCANIYPGEVLCVAPA
ncbi:hypothetical protein BDN70DRAFT_45302 [Pholiota conissans]|uniref:LysM domain-containing protein n=1 Tax=Pholiota conissans TaxID=109636 RepID=A0A9P5YZP9_9AGAR|nr:hypothetical protein BDN70DRAFT_45302 [Pholiota conissans]